MQDVYVVYAAEAKQDFSKVMLCGKTALTLSKVLYDTCSDCTKLKRCTSKYNDHWRDHRTVISANKIGNEEKFRQALLGKTITWVQLNKCRAENTIGTYASMRIIRLGYSSLNRILSG